jgi:hypothetical protein
MDGGARISPVCRGVLLMCTEMYFPLCLPSFSASEESLYTVLQTYR